MILRTYARLFTNDMEASLTALRALTGGEPDYRFTMEEQHWEIVGIGDFLVVAGTDEALAAIRSSHGPVVVDNLSRCTELLRSVGAKILKEPATSATGTYLYARHLDGNNVEYVEWNPEIRLRVLGR